MDETIIESKDLPTVQESQVTIKSDGQITISLDGKITFCGKVEQFTKDELKEYIKTIKMALKLAKRARWRR